MNVNGEHGSLGVARSFKKEICMWAPGSCMPACHAKSDCFSRNWTLGRTRDSGAKLKSLSDNAIPIARDAGPKPMQTRSSGSDEVPGERVAAMSSELRAEDVVGEMVVE